MPQFDPFGWCANRISAHILHRLIRIVGVIFFTYFLFHRVIDYPNYLLKPLWGIETAVYLVLIAAFLVRSDPIDRSRGVKEILIPLAGGTLPFLFLLTPPHSTIYTEPILLHLIFWWMTVATAFVVWSMWILRHSLSITVEARTLITSGPYRSIRHPIYAGHILNYAAVIIWRWSWINFTLYLLFIIVQLFRAKWEEEKLIRHYPEYVQHREKSWWPSLLLRK